MTARPGLAAAVARSTVDFVCGVPDSVLSDATAELERTYDVHYLPREDAAVAAAVGAALNGGRPLVFMKNAGLGNALDALVSLAVCHAVPVIVVVGWAGTRSDRLGHHVVWGDRTAAVVGSVSEHCRVVGEGPDDGPGDLAGYIDEGFELRQVRFLLVRPGA